MSFAFDTNGYPTWVPWIVGEPADGDVLTWDAAASQWQPAAGGGGGGAPTNAQYVVLALDGSLTAERVLTAGTGISITDGGAGGPVTVASTVTPGTLVTSGSATLAFGASMAQEASVAVTGQTGILVGSKVWAWLVPTATTQHSADEIMVNPVAVFAGNIVAGTGFTIYGNAYNLPGSQAYGDYTVAWAWV